MPRKILVINGHPDQNPERLGNALTEAYVESAKKSGHETRVIALSTVNFPAPKNTDDVSGEPPAAIVAVQEDIRWAEHIVVLYPLWIGGPPGLLKTYFEQICRYDFTFDHKYTPLLKGRTARIIITMSIPRILFRVMFSQGTKGFIRATLWSAGIKPTKITTFGKVETADKKPWFAAVKALGAAGK